MRPSLPIARTLAGPTMAERRTTLMPHLRCECELCAGTDGELVLHEYELVDEPLTGSTIYRRSYASWLDDEQRGRGP
jgi:hypothetical protein